MATNIALIIALALVFLLTLYVWRTFPIVTVLWRTQASQANISVKMGLVLDDLGWRVEDLESKQMKDVIKRLDRLERVAKLSPINPPPKARTTSRTRRTKKVTTP